MAELAVPALADLCLVHLIDDNEQLYTAGLACADPARRALLHEMLDRYPPDPDGSFSLADVLREQEARATAERVALGASGGALRLISEDEQRLITLYGEGLPGKVARQWEHVALDASLPICDVARKGWVLACMRSMNLYACTAAP